MPKPRPVLPEGKITRSFLRAGLTLPSFYDPPEDEGPPPESLEPLLREIGASWARQVSTLEAEPDRSFWHRLRRTGPRVQARHIFLRQVYDAEIIRLAERRRSGAGEPDEEVEEALT